MSDNKKVLTTSIEVGEKEINKIIFYCYLWCCIFMAIFGVPIYFVGDANWPLADMLLYYGILFVPSIFSFYYYKKGKSSKDMRMHIYANLLFFYTFVEFTEKNIAFAFILLPMLMAAIAYNDVKFVSHIGMVISVLNGLSIAKDIMKYGVENVNVEKVYLFLVIIISAFFLKVGMEYAQKIQERKANEIDKERQRFKAIVSIGIARIFEYNIKEDRLMSASSFGGEYSEEQNIEEFSTVVKTRRLVPFSDWYRVDEILNESKSGFGVLENEIRLKEQDGDYRWYKVIGRVIYDENGMPERVIGSLEDIDDAKRVEFLKEDSKKRDALTRLYKRPFIDYIIDDYLAEQDSPESALLIIDIDRLKDINDEMGKAFGDEIIRNVADDLNSMLRDEAILGRMEGDVFLVLLKGIAEPSKIKEKVKLIQDKLANIYTGKETDKGCSVSIGAALYPKHGVEFFELLGNASKALALEKSKGTGHYGIYNEAFEDSYDQVYISNGSDVSYDDDYDRERTSLIELAFKLIRESKDTDSAINLLIRQMMRELNLDCITIIQKSSNEQGLTILYKCGLDDIIPVQPGSRIELTDEQMEALIESYNTKDYMYACNSQDSASSDSYKAMMLANGVEAFVGCAYYEEGEFIGAMEFLDVKSPREWTDEERLIIKEITNVVSSYLLKLKAYEDASLTVERLTGYDGVTGLYKYEKFIGLVNDYIETAEHGNYAMAYLDFSGFKYINETYGYENGDRVLREMANTLTTFSENVIYSSRIFSDNIVIFLNLKDFSEDQIKKHFDIAIRKFNGKLNKEFKDSEINVNIGVCPFTVSGGIVPLQNIISNANLARKKAKEPNMPRCIFYDEKMGNEMKNEIAYANDMDTALKNREFVVFLQPKVDLESGKINGAEALIRWKKQDGNIIYPNDFIPIFEKNKSVTALDYYVYEEVCRYLRGRLDAGLPVVRISVNVSRIHLYSIDDFITYVKGLILKYNIDPSLLEFELTETTFTDKVDDTVELLTRLRKIGVVVSMDDFGSGYSSLNVLTKLPLDVLKMDKEFLKDFESDSGEKIIIPSVIEMAKKLNLAVLCEGVETIEQAEFLRNIGCDYAQGYYYSKPIEIEKFDAMLANN